MLCCLQYPFPQSYIIHVFQDNLNETKQSGLARTTVVYKQLFCFFHIRYKLTLSRSNINLKKPDKYLIPHGHHKREINFIFTFDSYKQTQNKKEQEK